MQKARLELIEGGSITSPRGFQAAGVEAGIKPNGADLALVCSAVPCAAAGVFTGNRIKAAPVLLCQRRLAASQAQAVVVNSGCANAVTGERGLSDAEQMARLAAARLGISEDLVLVASTGVIGSFLPLDKIASAMLRMAPSADGGLDMARAIMTTDTFPKHAAVKVSSEAGDFTVGGVCKGAGMIHPDLATFLCFLTTDATVGSTFLKQALKEAVSGSFNMVTVDGETSTNDSVLLLANGAAGNTPINQGNGGPFRDALQQLCLYLARLVAGDGEGATKLITVTVTGAASEADARLAARTVASSPLVKSAVHGNDPNWGRVVCALGRSGVEISESRTDLYFGNLCVLKSGRPQAISRQEAASRMEGREVAIEVCLNLGSGQATAYGCDLSEEYVTINSAYTT